MISEEEKAKRRYNWEQAKASIALEGLSVSQDLEKAIESYFNGEVEIKDIIKMYRNERVRKVS